jgi:hypothetical protein
MLKALWIAKSIARKTQTVNISPGIQDPAGANGTRRMRTLVG